MVVDLTRWPDLQHLAGAHDRDAVRHGQRFFLIVRDEDEGDPGLGLETLQLDLHLLAQFQIERGERLVEQKHARARGERAGERHTLLLATGNLRRLAVGHRLHLDQLQHPRNGLVDLGLRLAQHLEREADVLRHGHVREEGVGLEDGVDGPLVRRQIGDVGPAELDAARCRLLEAGDHPQERGLAATRRAEKREELVFGNRQADVVQRPDRILAAPEYLAEFLDFDVRPGR